MERNPRVEGRAPRAPFTIGLIQDHATPDLAANLQRTDRLVRHAASKGAQVVCLKELFQSPYFCKSQQSDRFDLAEPIPGPTTDAMQRLAHELGLVMIVPIFERQAAGIYRNSAAIIDADGSLLGTYRKMHIPDDPLFNEKYYFTPGDADRGSDTSTRLGGFKVWNTRYATIGVLICWDQWYPEAARITSLLGADVLFYPTAIGWHPS
jgi:N-carbamoylputrescine amidase